MNCVLGIDGGGSKTICVLMDETGKVIGRGKAGSSNYQVIGIKATLISLESAILAAIIDAFNVKNNLKIVAICLGLAGVGRAKDIEVIQSLVSEFKNSKLLGITWDLPPSNIVICHDALTALVGGVGDSVGVVTIAGTGSIVFGQNSLGKTKRVGGWGYILGDEGSAYKIAVAGMQAALKAYDGRGMSTNLGQYLQEYLGIPNIEDLIEVIYRQGWGVKEIAALAPIVDSVAATGDLLANNIIHEAVQELVIATSTVINGLFPPGDGVEIVTTGSVWQGKSQIREKFSESIAAEFPGAKVILPRHEPVIGACLLARQRIM